MVKSHGDFVTIIDLPEGEHQYKFFVDGEWRHDPGLVSIKFNDSVFIVLYVTLYKMQKIVTVTENCRQWHGL